MISTEEHRLTHCCTVNKKKLISEGFHQHTTIDIFPQCVTGLRYALTVYESM